MDAVHLRFAAALMHSVPDARLMLSHDNGVVTTVSYEDGAELNPCDWRTVVANTCRPRCGSADLSYPSRIVDIRFERGFDPIGPVARRVHDGCVEFWFASTLHPERLRDVFMGYPCPLAPSTLESGVLGDSDLRVSVGMLREVAPCARPHLQTIAMDLATAAAVAELIGEGVWAASAP
ncbi:MAG: hypothetical protein AAFP84_20775 [Actinomycetota bacterium]